MYNQLRSQFERASLLPSCPVSDYQVGLFSESWSSSVIHGEDEVFLESLCDVELVVELPASIKSAWCELVESWVGSFLQYVNFAGESFVASASSELLYDHSGLSSSLLSDEPISFLRVPVVDVGTISSSLAICIQAEMGLAFDSVLVGKRGHGFDTFTRSARCSSFTENHMLDVAPQGPFLKTVLRLDSVDDVVVSSTESNLRTVFKKGP
jgi:hypothetical protein